MNITTTEVRTPLLRESVRIMMICDMHLTIAGESDPAAIAHADARREVFAPESGKTTEEIFRAFYRYADENGVDLIVLPGDIIDFPTKENLEFFIETVENSAIPTVYCQGNHDWHFPGGMEHGGDPAEIEALFRRLLGDDLDVVETTVKGVRFIGFDNANSFFTEKHYEVLKAACDAGEPIVPFFHVPIYAETLWQKTVEVWKLPILVNLAPKMREHHPFWDGTNPASSMAFGELLADPSSPVIMALAGHVHFRHDDDLGTGKMQYIGETGTHDAARIFDLVPAEG